MIGKSVDVPSFSVLLRLCIIPLADALPNECARGYLPALVLGRRYRRHHQGGSGMDMFAVHEAKLDFLCWPVSGLVAVDLFVAFPL